MTSPASRAGALVAIGLLSVLAPIMGAGTALLFGGIGLIVLATPRRTRLFTLLATSEDLESGRLRSLGLFSLAVMILAIPLAIETAGFTPVIFTLTVSLVAFGWAGASVSRSVGWNWEDGIVTFFIVGTIAGIGSYAVVWILRGVETGESLALVVFLASVGGLIGGLYRAELGRYDGLEVLPIGIVLWVFAGLGTDLTPSIVVVAIVITVILGMLAYATVTASVSGMLSGILLTLITFVFGGFAWFVILFAFFAVGGLATKYHYDEKAAQGVAEADEGARGSANVMSNGLIPLLAVIGWAAAESIPSVDLPPEIFLFAFVGGVATALADTLASEIGMLYRNPRLITTLEPVPPGTDGAVTVQGHIAGVAGAAAIAGLFIALIPDYGVIAFVQIVVAGFVGMSADSLFGATLEGDHFGNEGVNFLATAVGATVGAIGFLIV